MSSPTQTSLCGLLYHKLEKKNATDIRHFTTTEKAVFASYTEIKMNLSHGGKSTREGWYDKSVCVLHIQFLHWSGLMKLKPKTGLHFSISQFETHKILIKKIKLKMCGMKNKKMRMKNHISEMASEHQLIWLSCIKSLEVSKDLNGSLCLQSTSF